MKIQRRLYISLYWYVTKKEREKNYQQAIWPKAMGNAERDREKPNVRQLTSALLSMFRDRSWER
jgi:hypothetical protein